MDDDDKSLSDDIYRVMETMDGSELLELVWLSGLRFNVIKIENRVLELEQELLELKESNIKSTHAYEILKRAVLEM